ncbi:hypothetical protein [Glycomyces artemisiae]|uniref:Excreted virulence factor EspC (Type VII ESX diderm) n=1 Tax=Glycomyces artemisiae TaxID=1076443 RepID=A0A2T0UEA6_9ACTN|nr:hypothetical protein [Glycomyces artemisiae]PRY56276.1 hypothetical protein B0I28_110159 [Glycomyces artemisiae]
MGGRKIDTEEMRDVADNAVSVVVDLYYDLVNDTADAGLVRDEAFSDANGSVHSFGSSWDQCFKLFYNCLYETSAASEAYQKALKKVADDAEDDEAMFESSFDEARDDELGSDYTTVEDQVKDQGIDPQTDDAYDLEEAPNPYEDELS